MEGKGGKTARDVMQTGVVSVGTDTPLTRLGQLFVEEGIHGAPVVGEDERLLGVVSVVDLLRAIGEEHDAPSNAPVYFRELLEFSAPDWPFATSEDFQDRLAQLTVGDVMQTPVITVTENTPVRDIAKSMRSNRIHRVLVVRDGLLVGIVSALDLVGLLES